MAGHREGRVRPRRRRPATAGDGEDLLAAIRCPPRAGCTWSSAPSPAGTASTRSPRRAASTRGSWTRSPQVAEEAAALAGRPLSTLSRPTSSARRSGSGCPTRASPALTGVDRGRGPRATATRSACAPVFKTVDTCAGEFPARTPYHYSTYEEETEVAPAERPRVVILGAGPEPDRAGHRVRLRVRARGVRAGGGGVRVGDGELQPGDGLDRLRHVEPPLLRAAVGRGRAGGLPRRAARSA